MKKIAIWTLAGILFVSFAAPAAGAFQQRDLKIIKKAVRENPSYRSGREVTRFNLEIRETRGHREKVRITLPLALFDLLFRCADNEHLQLEDCEVDIRELYEEMKKAGPRALLEIEDRHGSFRIWLD